MGASTSNSALVSSNASASAELAQGSPNMPWWAQEMGMTEAEYWGGLQQAETSGPNQSGNRMQPVTVTQVRDMPTADHPAISPRSCMQFSKHCPVQ